METKQNNAAQNLPLIKPHSPATGKFLTLEVGVEMRAGEVCPRCRLGTLDYDGLLNLSCPECGYTLAGCFT